MVLESAAAPSARPGAAGRNQLRSRDREGPLRRAPHHGAVGGGPVLRPGLRSRPGPLLADGDEPPHGKRRARRAFRRQAQGHRRLSADNGLPADGGPRVRDARRGHQARRGRVRGRRQRLHLDQEAPPAGPRVRAAAPAGGQGEDQAVDRRRHRGLGQDDEREPRRLQGDRAAAARAHPLSRTARGGGLLLPDPARDADRRRQERAAGGAAGAACTQGSHRSHGRRAWKPRLERLRPFGQAHRHRQADPRKRRAPADRDAVALVRSAPGVPGTRRGRPLCGARLFSAGRPRRGHRAQRADLVGHVGLRRRRPGPLRRAGQPAEPGPVRAQRPLDRHGRPLRDDQDPKGARAVRAARTFHQARADHQRPGLLQRAGGLRAARRQDPARRHGPDRRGAAMARPGAGRRRGRGAASEPGAQLRAVPPGPFPLGRPDAGLLLCRCRRQHRLPGRGSLPDTARQGRTHSRARLGRQLRLVRDRALRPPAPDVQSCQGLHRLGEQPGGGPRLLLPDRSRSRLRLPGAPYRRARRGQRQRHLGRRHQGHARRRAGHVGSRDTALPWPGEPGAGRQGDRAARRGAQGAFGVEAAQGRGGGRQGTGGHGKGARAAARLGRSHERGERRRRPLCLLPAEADRGGLSRPVPGVAMARHRPQPDEEQPVVHAAGRDERVVGRQPDAGGARAARRHPRPRFPQGLPARGQEARQGPQALEMEQDPQGDVPQHHPRLIGHQADREHLQPQRARRRRPQRAERHGLEPRQAL